MGQVPVYFNLWSRLREVGDVILLDQRGTGMSSPNLQCSPSTLPNDVFETAAKSLDAYTMIVKKCADDWRSKGTNLTAYNSDS